MTIFPHSIAGRRATRALVGCRSPAHTIARPRVLADVAVIIVVSIPIGWGYHLAIYGELGPLRELRCRRRQRGGRLRAARPSFRGEYGLATTSSFKPHARRVFTYWNITFVALLALAFVTRAPDDYSRASMLLFYVIGLPAVVQPLRPRLDR